MLSVTNRKKNKKSAARSRANFDRASLPDDPAVLKRMIKQKREEEAVKDAMISVLMGYRGPSGQND